MTETRPTVADELRFDLGQHVRIRKTGCPGTIVKVFRCHYDPEWRYVVRFHDPHGYGKDAEFRPHELAASLEGA